MSLSNSTPTQNCNRSVSSTLPTLSAAMSTPPGPMEGISLHHLLMYPSYQQLYEMHATSPPSGSSILPSVQPLSSPSLSTILRHPTSSSMLDIPWDQILELATEVEDIVTSYYGSAGGMAPNGSSGTPATDPTIALPAQLPRGNSLDRVESVENGNVPSVRTMSKQ